MKKWRRELDKAWTPLIQMHAPTYRRQGGVCVSRTSSTPRTELNWAWRPSSLSPPLPIVLEFESSSPACGCVDIDQSPPIQSYAVRLSSRTIHYFFYVPRRRFRDSALVSRFFRAFASLGWSINTAALPSVYRACCDFTSCACEACTTNHSPTCARARAFAFLLVQPFLVFEGRRPSRV